MNFSSSWFKGIFIMALLFSFYFETAFTDSRNPRSSPPDCNQYKQHGFRCTEERTPICGTDGITYANGCIFCYAVTFSDSSGTLGYSHDGEC